MRYRGSVGKDGPDNLASLWAAGGGGGEGIMVGPGIPDKRPMKILLIMPPTSLTLVLENPNEVVEAYGAYPPLGLLYIAACVRERTKHEVRVLDCDTDRLGFEEMEAQVRAFGPDVVGMTAYTPNICCALEAAGRIKRINPAIITVLGGHHSDIYPLETYAQGSIDFIGKGEGESTFPRLLEAIEKKSGFEEIPGLVWQRDGQVVNNPGYGYVEDLNSLPMPARDLVDWRKHNCVMGREKIVASVLSSRGCPCQCTFCYKPLDSRSYRMRSPANILAEIEQCMAMGIREFFFYDENFNVSTRRVEEFCDEIISRKLGITWSFRGRVNTITEPLLRKCRQAGCHRIHFGVETDNDEELRRVKKDITVEMVRRAFTACRRAGIESIGNFMLGMPWDRKEDMFRRVKFAQSIGADYLEFNIFTPYPKTELYAECIQKGMFGDFWLEFAKHPDPDFQPPTASECYSRQELFDFLEGCMKKFYFRPRQILRTLFRIRSWRELKNKARAGMALLNFRRMIYPKSQSPRVRR